MRDIRLPSTTVQQVDSAEGNEEKSGEQPGDLITHQTVRKAAWRLMRGPLGA